MSNRTCTIDGCARPHVAKGMCNLHWRRSRRPGGLDAPVREKFATPEEAFEASTMPVTESGCLLWMRTPNTNGYGNLRVDGRTRSAHRFAWERVNGPIPEGMHLDHLCWVRSCCNVDHLRLVTHAQNHQNRGGARAGSRSGIRGVSWHVKTGKWQVRVILDRKIHYGGLFTDKEEAGRVASEMRARLMTHSQN